MGKTYESITDELRAFLEAQPLYFVATAPSATPGRVNLSPKGFDSLRVLDPHTVAYLDLVGSGVETIAHLREDGRIVIMACAFTGSPNIVRLWGQGDVVEPADPGFAELRGRFPDLPGAAVRSVVRVRVEQVADSCGWGVPIMDLKGERPQHVAWAEKRGPEGLALYQRERNARSLDGLRGLRSAEGTATLDGFSEPTARWRARGRFVSAGGHRVFVVEAGQGPTLLLLHGFPTSSHDYRRLIDRLAGSFRCVALDFVGFGLSAKPAAWSYSLFQQADVVEAVVRRLGVENAHIVSHDMGTSVHGELLARAREGSLAFKVERSTFLNGSMLQWLATITPFQELLARNSTLHQGMQLCEQIEAVYVPGLRALMRRPEAISEEDAVVMRELLMHGEGHRRLPALAGYMRERYLHAERWIGAMAAAGSALQLVWADGDPIAHAELGRELARRCPEARHTELAGLGHFLLVEDPEQVAREIGRPADPARADG
jgi:pimeloyl-ACP methyl ester carboxylesterase